MKKEVKYDNVINSLQFKKFTAIDYNLFMFICQEMKNQGSAEKTFAFKYIKSVTNFGNHTDSMFVKKLDAMCYKLKDVSSRIESGNTITYLNIFTILSIDADEKTFTVKVNEDYLFLLNDISDKFTSFELQEFVELDGKYSKALYMRFKQFKFNGWWKPTVEEMRMCLDIPKSYKPKSIMKDIIKPSLERLAPFFPNIKCETITAKKKGAPVERYYFTWKPEENKKEKSKENNVSIFKPKKNSFNNIEQHEYDFDEFERLMLDNWGQFYGRTWII